MTQRQTMIVWTAKQIRQSNTTDVAEGCSQLFSKMSRDGHAWATEIEKYSWKHFVSAVERKLNN